MSSGILCTDNLVGLNYAKSVHVLSLRHAFFTVAEQLIRLWDFAAAPPDRKAAV